MVVACVCIWCVLDVGFLVCLDMKSRILDIESNHTRYYVWYVQIHYLDGRGLYLHLVCVGCGPDIKSGIPDIESGHTRYYVWYVQIHYLDRNGLCLHLVCAGCVLI